MTTPRQFEDKPAVRREVPLLVGLCGPSGSGKTKSALRIAEGMQQVTGGEIFGIDSEAARMLHYADKHKFRHVPFAAPFSPLDYLDAVEHCVNKGGKNIIIDSTSHMHDGVGGTLEFHDEECERLMAAWKKTYEAVQISAWKEPKRQVRKFLNRILQLRINLIFCFRADEKIKVIPGKAPQQLGFMPIVGKGMIYEMTLSCLLLPGCKGVPTWHPAEMGEKAVVKLPEHFAHLFPAGQVLDESIGRRLAEWAAGGAAPAAVDPLAAGREAAIKGSESLKTWWNAQSKASQKAMKQDLDSELKPLAAAADKQASVTINGVTHGAATPDAPLTEEEMARLDQAQMAGG